MEFFIDTANLEEIEKAKAYGLIDGVTTNPTLLAREGGDWRAQAIEVVKLVDGPVSLEVIGDTAEAMLAEALDLVKFGPNVVVKVPMTMEGLKAMRLMRAKDIDVNCTLIFSANQALLAAKAGATYVSPFVGRLDAVGQEGMALIEEIRTIFDNYDYQTKILVASIRHPGHVKEAALIGADVVTVPYDVLATLAKHPLTDSGLAAFLEDWKKVSG